jgi:hypothetical protein
MRHEVSYVMEVRHTNGEGREVQVSTCSARPVSRPRNTVRTWPGTSRRSRPPPTSRISQPAFFRVLAFTDMSTLSARSRAEKTQARLL